MMKELQIKASMLLVGYIASLDIVFLLLGKGNSSFWLSDKFFYIFSCQYSFLHCRLFHNPVMLCSMQDIKKEPRFF